MARFGGAAVVRSTRGEGTEVELSCHAGSGQVTDGRDPAPAPRRIGGAPGLPGRRPRLFRAGVRAELGDAVEVVGEADEVGAAVELIAERLPDVVLLDVHIPGGGGQAVIEACCRTTPRSASSPCRCPTPPRTSSTSSGPAPGATSPRPSRAPSSSTPSYRVAAGDAVFSPRLAGFVLDAFAAEPSGAGRRDSTPSSTSSRPREREVLRLIARGYAYKEVARELGISVKTVETHVSSVLRKLQLSTRHELTRWATERRLV